jgi:hypothetical protein
LNVFIKLPEFIKNMNRVVLFSVAGVLIFFWLRALYFMFRFILHILDLGRYLKQYNHEEYRSLFGDWFPFYTAAMGLRLWGFILSSRVEEDNRTQEIKQLIRRSLFQFCISVGIFLGFGFIMSLIY